MTHQEQCSGLPSPSPKASPSGHLLIADHTQGLRATCIQIPPPSSSGGPRSDARPWSQSIEAPAPGWATPRHLGSLFKPPGNRGGLLLCSRGGRCVGGREGWQRRGCGQGGRRAQQAASVRSPVLPQGTPARHARLGDGRLSPLWFNRVCAELGRGRRGLSRTLGSDVRTGTPRGWGTSPKAAVWTERRR